MILEGVKILARCYCETKINGHTVFFVTYGLVWDDYGHVAGVEVGRTMVEKKQDGTWYFSHEWYNERIVAKESDCEWVLLYFGDSGVLEKAYKIGELEEELLGC